jgi:hypothetical protein
MTDALRGAAGDDTPEQMARKAAKAKKAPQPKGQPQPEECEYGTP